MRPLTRRSGKPARGGTAKRYYLPKGRAFLDERRAFARLIRSEPENYWRETMPL
jgi:hypothetical protein